MTCGRVKLCQLLGIYGCGGFGEEECQTDIVWKDCILQNRSLLAVASKTTSYQSANFEIEGRCAKIWNLGVVVYQDDSELGLSTFLKGSGVEPL